MKKTLKQQKEHLSHLLEESQQSDRNGNIILIGFAAIIIVLVIFANVQNTTISELERKIEIQQEEVVWYESKIQNLKNKEAMQNWCQELADVSGKAFYISLGSCRLKGNEQIRLDNISEISDSILHYQLGSKK